MIEKTILRGIEAVLFRTSRRKSDHTELGGALSNLAKVLINADNKQSQVITSAAKRTTIGSNVYIEDTLVTDFDKVVELMGVLNQLFTGYTLVALSVFDKLRDGDVISETIGRIAMEDLQDEGIDASVVEVIAEMFKTGDLSAGLEAKGDTADIDQAIKTIATGRLIEFEFSGFASVNDPSDASARPVKIPLYVQLFPVGMPSETAYSLIANNYPEKLSRRWLKAIVREKRWFADVLFSSDLIKQHRKALRDDRSNVLADFHHNKLKKQSNRVYDIVSGKIRNNLANSMVVITAATNKRIADEAGIDLANYADRQKFFNEAYGIMLVIVDTHYDIVTIYLNGIRGQIEIPARALKQMSSTKSGIDIDEIMASLAKGSAPTKF